MKKRSWWILGVLSILILVGGMFYTEILGAQEEKGKKLNFLNVSQQLSQKGYYILAIYSGPAEKADVRVEVSDAVSDKKDAEEEITKLMKKKLKKEGYINGTVQVDFVNLKKVEQKRRWFSVVPVIDKKLKSASDTFKGIAIDLNPKPVTYILKSTHTKSNVDKTEVKQWIGIANEIITANDLPSILEDGEVYEIVVRGSDEELLLSKRFGK
ncbi:hypothetical protein [Thalassobacillus pellis]|uniref:hypothetical protein n=1 Tax=Thalassobacillus pellis TaxID=748008 RepID=UPI001961F6AE|nr:hypothetical protein [Thalassobacillus pellis]MBM7553908.1 hypothetical protein [Thalassobacillus pellis]